LLQIDLQRLIERLIEGWIAGGIQKVGNHDIAELRRMSEMLYAKDDD